MAFFDHFPYTETYDNGHEYHFTGKCRVTGDERTVTVKGQELFRYRSGELIQNALKSVNDDDREFLLSGITIKGWDRLNNKSNDTDK